MESPESNVQSPKYVHGPMSNVTGRTLDRVASEGTAWHVSNSPWMRH